MLPAQVGCARDIITLCHVMINVLSGRRVLCTALQLALGAEGYVELKLEMVSGAMQATLNLVPDARVPYEHIDNVQTLLRNRLLEMNNKKLQALLLPAFKEDEWTLITLGALLGGLAGSVQLRVMQLV